MLHLILQKNHDFLINMIQQVIPSPVFRAFFGDAANLLI